MSDAVARTNPESAIQSAICDYLTLRGKFFIRLNNIPATFIDKTGARQFRRLGKYARSGLADILVVEVGHAIFLEVKAGKGKQSPDQIDFQRDCIRAGAAYHLVRSISDVQELGL